MASWNKTEFVKVATVDELPEGEMVPFFVGDQEVLVVMIRGKFYAINDICTHVKTNLSGGTLAEDRPLDATVPTRDLVRAMRAGNPSDVNGGFLLDLDSPKIVGQWPLTVEQAEHDASGADIDFVLDVAFDTVCRAAPEPGDVIDTGDRLLEVLEEARMSDPAYREVAVRIIGIPGGRFVDHGAVGDLRRTLRLDAEGLTDQVREALATLQARPGRPEAIAG